MIDESKLDELKVAWQLVDANKFHNLKTGYASIRSVQGYSFANVAESFNRVQSYLIDAQTQPALWSDMHPATFDGIVTKVKNLQPQIDELQKQQSSQDPQKSSSLQQFFNQIQQLHEPLVTHNILFQKRFFADPSSVEATLNVVKKIADDIPEYRKRLDELLSEGALNAITSGFRTRKESIQKNRKFYMYGLGGALTTALGATVSFFAFFPLPQGYDLKALSEYFALRVIVLAPLYLAVAFLWKEHGRERALEEEYGFREAVSGVMPALLATMDNVDKKHAVSESTLNRIFAPIRKPKETTSHDKILKEVRLTLKAMALKP